MANEAHHEVEAVVLEVDKASQHDSLGVKQIAEAPGSIVAKAYKPERCNWRTAAVPAAHGVASPRGRFTLLILADRKSTL